MNKSQRCDLFTLTKYDIEMLREASDRVESITPEMQDEALWDVDEDILSKLCGLE